MQERRRCECGEIQMILSQVACEAFENYREFSVQAIEVLNEMIP
jgi:hypothetical protein